LADLFGISFSLDNNTAMRYLKSGIDLEKNHGNKEYKLPYPATYLVGPSGVIEYAYIEKDHTKRVDSRFMLELIKKRRVKHE